MTKPRYIAHTSGKQPVRDDVKVVVIFRDRWEGNVFPASMFRWGTLGNDADIIAYRVISQDKG